MFSHQQREVICRDGEILHYLFSGLHRGMGTCDGGSGYKFTVHFSTGRVCRIHGACNSKQLNLCIPSGSPGDPYFPTHFVTFPPTAPKRVRDFADFLDAPHEDVAGLLLTIEAGKPFTYEYRPGLHGGNPIGKRVAELTGGTAEPKE